MEWADYNGMIGPRKKEVIRPDLLRDEKTQVFRSEWVEFSNVRIGESIDPSEFDHLKFPIPEGTVGTEQRTNPPHRIVYRNGKFLTTEEDDKYVKQMKVTDKVIGPSTEELRQAAEKQKIAKLADFRDQQVAHNNDQWRRLYPWIGALVITSAFLIGGFLYRRYRLG